MSRLQIRLAPLALVALMVADFLLLAGLALRRHDSFNSNALDLGYHDQVIWNTLHGRPFHFSTYHQDEQAPFWIDVPLGRIRDPYSLLSYHVEPLLVLIAPIYWVWDDVRALLLLQAVVLTLGAWPAYRLGCRCLGQPWAGVGVASLYLLAPARQAAALSDFHTVAFTAPLFLVALDALGAGKARLFLLASLLCLIAREDTAIMVTGLALYAAIFQPRLRRPALALAGGSLLYLYLVTQVIMPYYNGLQGSTYLYRYSQFGATLGEMAQNLLYRPQLYWAWLRRPDISAYLGGLLATGGWVLLAAPEILVIALPVALLNTLANTGWPSSGGAHYSVSLVPFLVAASAIGLARLGRWAVAISRWWPAEGGLKARGQVTLHAVFAPFSALGRPFFHPMVLLMSLMLIVALRFQIEQGVMPFSRRWSWPSLGAHTRLGPKILELIPPDAPISAQSGLYPHLSHRAQAYQFPTIADASYIVLDVTSQPAPLDYEGYFRHVRLALINPSFGPLAAGDGYFVLQRGAPKRFPLVEEFLTFTLAQPEEIEQPLQADFGNTLRLEGYTLILLPVIDQRGPHVQVTTFWRALRAAPGNFQPVFSYASHDGAIVYQQPQSPFELYWRPTGEWQTGVLYKLTMPELRVTNNIAEAWLALVPVGSDLDAPVNRLTITPGPDNSALEISEANTLLHLLKLPE
jgi:uncharacterized membrane protein